MSDKEWKEITDFVTNAMLVHTAPFVTPLSTETDTTVLLEGSGTYVELEGRRFVLTCEHVACHQPIHYRFRGSEDVFELPEESWVMERHPVDAAFARLSNPVWCARVHQAGAIPFSRFEFVHRPQYPEELMFFRGYASENAHFAFGVHETNGSGFCTQEIKQTGDEQLFELFWEPTRTQLTSTTSPAAKREIKFDDAHGLSGSLVWNTRYLEVSRQGLEWTPDEARVTGLLRRWDTSTKSLLAWRIQHLREWLGANRA